MATMSQQASASPLPAVSSMTNDDVQSPPAMPEQVHLHKTRPKREGSIEEQLHQAMLSPLFTMDRLARATLPTAASGDFAASVNNVSMPDSAQVAPSRSSQPLRRHRSLSTGSLDQDPFAWLRQTVQEQRETNPISPSSLPSSPIYTTVPIRPGHSEPGVEQDEPVKPDYFGASVLSLIAGREPVQKRMEEQVKRSSQDSPASSRLSFQPSLPTFEVPSLPKWEAPTLPDWKMPALPEFKAPSLPEFKAPTLPSATGWMPESLKGSLGINAGEGESQKYMDDADKTDSAEPDWARIKDKYEKPKFPVVFLHGLFGFSVLGPSALPALQIQYWRGVREALEQISTLR